MAICCEIHSHITIDGDLLGRWGVFFFLICFENYYYHFPCLCCFYLRILASLKAFAREKGKKNLKNYDKLLEVSIIISVGCLDNSTMMFNIMDKFTKERCVLALCALERRKSFKTTSKWYANFTFLAL